MPAKFVLRCCGLLLAVAMGDLVFAAPKIAHWTTDKGAEVYFVHAPEPAIVDIRLVCNAASARDGDKPGLALMTNHMLSQGAGDMDATAIAAAFEAKGAEFGSGSERDMAWVSLRSLSDPKLFDPALETLATVVSQPTFNKTDFDRERERAIVALQRAKQSPSDVAERAFFKAVYGDHPYASPSDGTEEGLKALTTNDLKAFHQKYYVAKNCIVAIVGSVDKAKAQSIAQRLMRDLPAGEAAPPIPEVPKLKEARTVRVDHPSTQTHIRIGQPGLERGGENYFALYTGNHALGGSGLVSILGEEVREKRGLSYSVFSYFSPMAQRGPFILGLQTKNDQADQAQEVAMQTLNDFLKQGISADRLEKSKKNITGGFPLRVDSNDKIVEYIAMIGFYGLPLDYLDTFPKQVDALSEKQVSEAMRERLDPANMVTVIVGGGTSEQAAVSTPAP